METNAIYCGDCRDVLMNHFPGGSVDLIYIDPPFFSNRQYEIIWGDGYELRAFEDRWKGGIKNYIAWMEPKVRECHRVLKKTGSMYLHCDWHANARLRLLMDEIFGEGNFRNEIVWQRTFAHSSAKRFGNVVDYLLFYTKTGKYTWNTQYQPYTQDYIDKFFRYEDKRGKYQSIILTGPGIRKGGSGKSWRGYNPTKVNRHWAVPRRVFDELKIPEDATPIEALEIMDKSGRVEWSKKGTPRFKQYLDEMPGVPMQNIWTDIPPISAQSNENLGYPTQKPKSLLERVINASSNPTDIVLDPMCGCGTAIAVAHKLKRRWIGIDISPTACKLMVKRMRTLGAKISEDDIIGLPRSYEDVKAMEPFEFQNWVCQKLLARASKRMVGDMGIDGWMMDGRPLQVKQSESVGRNVVDNFQSAIRRKNKTKGIIVAFSFTKGAYEEVAGVKLKSGLEIELKTVKDILAEE